MPIQGPFDDFLFDLDGVLLDSEPVNIAAAQKTFLDLGLPLTPEELDRIPGCASRVFIPEFLSVRGIANREEHNRLIAQNLENYDRLWGAKVALMPGVLETVSRLRCAGKTLAIVTTNRRSVVERFLIQFKLKGCFSVIVTGEEVKFLKPHPQAYLFAIERLGQKAERMVAVEDTATGVASAKDAGLTCVAIPNDHSRHHDFGRADTILSSLTDLYRFAR